MRRFAFSIAILILASSPAAFAAPEAAADSARRTPVVQAVEKAAPAVVNISTTRLAKFVDPLFQEFFGRYSRPITRSVQSVGSGVIVHPDGYVVTNSHVIQRATEIVVGLDGDGKEESYKAQLLADDPQNDLALLKIEADRKFPAVTLGRSDDLMIGEPAIAVGNPFSVGKTVTTGVVSAVGRSVTLPAGGSFEDFIQTDAAINPGNSGGALLNIHGDMIGVNTAIVTGGEGLGFAIPVDRVREILARLIAAAVDRANLGFTPVGGPDGVVVRQIVPDGAAGRGGLVEGDLIERVGPRAVTTVFDFATPLLGKRPGERIEVVVRRQGERRSVELTVPPPPMSPAVKYVVDRLGLVPRDPTEREQAAGVVGVVVDRVLDEGPAAAVRMETGDLIIGLAGRGIQTVDQLAALLQRADAGLLLDVDVVRNGRRMRGAITTR